MNFAYAFQDERGTVSSMLVDPIGGDMMLRPFNDSEKLATSPHIGGTLEIMSPSLSFPTSPRIFFDGEILHVSHQARRVAREGDPSGLRAPDRPTFTREAILGQGSVTLVDLENVSYGAGIGIAFPVRVGDFRILIKPSARYLRRTYEMSGFVSAAFRDGPNPANGGAFDLGPTREISLRASEDLDVDALGPSIEFDIEAIRMRSMGVSVFLNGAAFRILGDRSVSFSTIGLDSEGRDTYRADFSAVLSPWIFRAGMGLRIKWLGLPSGWLGRGGYADSASRQN